MLLFLCFSLDQSMELGKLTHLTTCGATACLDECMNEEECKKNLRPLSLDMYRICQEVTNTYHETAGMDFKERLVEEYKKKMESFKDQAMEGKDMSEIMQDEYSITDDQLENDPSTFEMMEKYKKMKLVLEEKQK